MSFKVGQKVVCIKSLKSAWENKQVIKNNTYTIRSVFNNCYDNAVLLRFEEIISMINPLTKQELGWPATLFRPLDEMFNEEIAEIQEFINQPELV